MKNFMFDILVGAFVVLVLGTVVVRCDVAQAQNVNAPASSMNVAAAAVTVVEEPGEAWIIGRRLTATDETGCAEYRAHRIDEIIRHRVRACRDGEVTLIQ